MLSVSSEHSFNHFFDNLTFRFIAFGYPHPALQWKNKQAKYSKYLYLPNFMKVKSLQVIQTMTAINLKPVHKRTDPDCIMCFIWYIIWKMNETVFLIAPLKENIWRSNPLCRGNLFTFFLFIFNRNFGNSLRITRSCPMPSFPLPPELQ